MFYDICKVVDNFSTIIFFPTPQLLGDGSETTDENTKRVMYDICNKSLKSFIYDVMFSVKTSEMNDNNISVGVKES